MQKEKIKDLVALAQNGDQEAFSELLEAYSPLIQSMISKFRLEEMSSADVEDLRQEAVFAFYNALVSYDPQISEVEFGLYAKICIYNRLVSQVRIMKKHIENSSISYNTEELLKYVAKDGDPSQNLVEREQVGALLKLIVDNLSDMENRVFMMYISGMSAAEMADKLKISEKSVNNSVYRLRKKIKKLLQK
jgi:RNA polymerase sporulation-specific sigma factor